MKRLLAYCAAATIGIAAPVGGVFGQDADDRDVVARQAPIFDLQPGEPREQPQPDIQGPRAPGIAPPRLIDQDADNAAEAATASTVAPIEPESNPAREQASLSEPPPRQVAAPSPSAEAATGTQGTVVRPLPQPPVGGMAANETQRSTDAIETDPIPAATSESGEGIPWWAWLTVFFGVAVLIGVAATLHRKRDRDTAPVHQPFAPKKRSHDADVSPTPVRPFTRTRSSREPPTGLSSAGPVPAVSAAVPSSKARDAPSRINIEFVPLAARLSTLGLTLAYRLVIRNVGKESLNDVIVRLGIRCADGAGTQAVPSPGETCVNLATLEPGKTHTHAAEIRLDPKTYKPIQSRGKPMLVPIVDMMPQYCDADGILHDKHVALLVGRELEPPQQKMQPFWLQQGFGHFRGIGCRMLNADVI